MVNCHPHLDKIPKPETLCLAVFAKLPGFYGPSSESFYQGQVRLGTRRNWLPDKLSFDFLISCKFLYCGIQKPISS